jgi:hypothetical protein
MSTLAKTTDAKTRGGSAASAANAYELWAQNDQAERDVIYGPTRFIESSVIPHDHAGDGGEILGDPLLSAIVGPQASETAGGTPAIGVPYGIRASDDFLLDDGSTKLLGAFPLYLPGGVSGITLNVLVSYAAGLGSIKFHAQLVPFAKTNYRSQAAGVTGISATSSFGTSGLKKVDFTITDLTDLGDPRLDRFVELRIFQALTNAVAHRFCGVQVTVLTTTTGRLAIASDPPRVKLQVGDLLNGAITPELTARIRRIENGHAQSLLGRAPGLNADGTPDRQRTYQQDTYYPHQHQGRIVPQFDGTFISDGAVLRRAVVASYARNLGDDGAGNVDALPVKGIKIHSAGTLGSTWLRLKYRMPVSGGLGGLEVYFAVQPSTTDVKTELRAHVDVRPVGNPLTAGSIISAVKSGVHQAEANDADGYRVCQVDPLDNDAYQPNNTRRNKSGTSKGLWTLDAQLSAALTPSGVMRDTPARISQALRLDLTHKYYRSTDAYRQTQDYTVYLRVELKTLDSGNYDAGARLLWVLILPAKGW